MKYALAQSISEPKEEGKEVEKVSDEKILISGNEKYGDVSIWDLANHQVLLAKQIADLESADDEKYPNKSIELEQLAKDLLSEKEDAEAIIKDMSLSIDFNKLVNQIKGE